MTTLEHLLADPGNVGVWTLVPERSRIAFSCRSFWGLVPVKGTFTDFSGDGQLANGTAFGRVDVRAASLVTGIGRRDNHLRSDDFFAAERFPTISVVVTAVEPNSSQTNEGGADLRSSLTIRGITRPIPIAATVTALGGDTVEISASTTVDRTQWDVSGNLIGMVARSTALVAACVFTKSR